MWVRKTEEDIHAYLAKKETERKSLKRPLIFALIMSAISILLYSYGLRGSLRAGVIFSSSSSSLNPTIIFAGLVVFVMFFLIAIYHQRKGESLIGGDNDALLCRDCKQPSQATLSRACQCGGKLEPFSFFYWVDDESDSDKETKTIIA